MAPTQAQPTSLSPPPPQVTISGQPHFRRPRISPPKPADRIDIDIDYMISSNPSLMFAEIYTFFRKNEIKLDMIRSF